jgi:hypothetical protein
MKERRREETASEGFCMGNSGEGAVSSIPLLGPDDLDLLPHLAIIRRAAPLPPPRVRRLMKRALLPHHPRIPRFALLFAFAFIDRGELLRLRRRRNRRDGRAGALLRVTRAGFLDVFEKRVEAEFDGVDVPVKAMRFPSSVSGSGRGRVDEKRGGKRTRRNRNARRRPSSARE